MESQRKNGPARLGRSAIGAWDTDAEGGGLQGMQSVGARVLPPDAPESPPAGVASPLPVILVCGLGSTKEDWHTLATDLARDRV